MLFRTRAVVLFGALSLLTPLATATGVVASSDAGAAPLTHMLTCGFKLVARPGNYLLSCADANARLDRVHWTTWSASSAIGSGTLSQNGCTPNCASGHFMNYAATISLGRVISSPKYGKEFSRAIVHFKSNGKRTREVFYLAD